MGSPRAVGTRARRRAYYEFEAERAKASHISKEELGVRPG
jgi:hypothetical protein